MLLFSLVTLAMMALTVGVVKSTPARPEPVRIRVEEQPPRQRR